MHFDELEWVRTVIDRWLCANGPTLGVAVALVIAIASMLAGQ